MKVMAMCVCVCGLINEGIISLKIGNIKVKILLVTWGMVK